MKTIKCTALLFILPAMVSCGGGSSSSTTSDNNNGPVTPSGDSTCGTCNSTIKLDGTVTQAAAQDVTQAGGGSVTVSGQVQLTGTTVVIPAGSLKTDTTITVGQVSNSSLVPAGVLLTDIGPSGTQFNPALPASVSIKYDTQYVTDNNILDTSTLKVVAFDNDVAAETLRAVALDPSNNLVTANTTHFSRFAVMGYTNASLNGYYHLTSYNFQGNDTPVTAPAVGSLLPSPKGFQDQDLTIYFDGNGNWTMYAEIDNTDGTIDTIPATDFCSGVYTVQSDGTLTVPQTTSGCGGATGQVLVGGSTFVLSNLLTGDNPNLTIGVKRITSGYTNASLKGKYSFIDIYTDSTQQQLSAPNVGVALPPLQGFSESYGTISFDGKGSYTESATESRNGTSSTSTSSGTYSIASDGTMISTSTGDTSPGATGQLLAGGSILIGSETGVNNDPEMFMLVQQQAGAFSNATLKGDYTVASYGYDQSTTQSLMPQPGQTLPPPNGFIGTLAIVNFDGNGYFTVNATQNTDGTITSETSSGQYTVDSTGAISLTGGISGQVLADGSTFILGNTSPGDVSKIYVGLIR